MLYEKKYKNYIRRNAYEKETYYKDYGICNGCYMCI